MGQPTVLAVDAAGLQTIADRIDAIAETIGCRARRRMTFEGAPNVREYLDLLTGALTDWARVSQQTAYELRCAAKRYAESEDAAGQRLGWP